MEKNNLHTVSIGRVNNLRILGRTCVHEEMVPLFWTASGISVNTISGEVWALLEGDWSVYEPWVSVWVNGTQVSRFIVQKGKNWYCLFRGLPAGKPNEITLLKETQAMSADGDHLLAVHELGVPEPVFQNLAEGDIQKIFVPLEEKKLKIEFVGDSITTGEGLAGGVTEMDWITGWMALRDNYAVLTANKLNADFHIISQSGWGVTTSWDNDRSCALPKFYEQQAGVLWGARNESLGVKQPYDFSSWKADVVVINLGTNDWGAFNNPAKKDAATGEEWKLHLDEHKKPLAADLNYFTDGVFSFLQKVRRLNPHTEIIWCYGMCSFDLGEAIQTTVNRFANEMKDAHVHFVRLPCMSEETAEEKGSRQHPGPGTHHRVAAVLVKEIEKLLEKV